MKIGLEMKLYRNTGTYESPTWTEMTNVRDVTLNLEKGEADVTTRGSGGFRATKGTLKDASLEFESVYDPDDADYVALETAYFNDTALDVAVADGDIAVSGTKYIRAEMEVFSFSRSEPLEEGVTVSVSMKPTYSAHPPAQVTVGS
jgi:hypothetical protein